MVFIPDPGELRHVARFTYDIQLDMKEQAYLEKIKKDLADPISARISYEYTRRLSTARSSIYNSRDYSDDDS